MLKANLILALLKYVIRCISIHICSIKYNDFKTLELLDVEYNATFTDSGIYCNLNSRPLAKQSSMLDHKMLAHRKNILGLFTLGRFGPYTTNILQYILTTQFSGNTLMSLKHL